MNKLKLAILGGIIFWINGCVFDIEGRSTIVKGDLKNKITGDKLVNIPIEISRCSGGFLTISQCDSMQTIYTDSKGEFETSIATEKRYYYKIGVGNNPICESMYTTMQSILINKGERNIVNFTSTPFKFLRVDLKIMKENKNYLNISLQTNDTLGNWWGFSIINDTSRTNQIIERTLYFKVLPKRNYWLSGVLCNRTGYQIQDYIYKECDSRFNQNFYVDYVDTTRIEVK